MEITIRHTKDCPNLSKAESRLTEALARVSGKDVEIRRELVATPADAQRLGFVGSPTILVDGRDPFAEVDARPGLACRLYQTEDGSDGAPSVSQLVSALA